MTTYIVTLKATALEVYRYNADAPLPEHRGPEYLVQEVSDAYAAPDAPALPKNPEDWHITNLSFLSRWTDAEAIAIDLASIDNPSAPLAARQQSAAIRRAKEKQANALGIILIEPETIAGVTAMCGLLQMMGVIESAAVRIDQILNTPPLAKELYRS